MSRRFEDAARRLRSELEVERRSEAELEAGRRRLLVALERRPERSLGLLLPAAAAAAFLIAMLMLPRPKTEEPVLVIAAGAECVSRAENALEVEPCATEVEIEVRAGAEDVALRRGRARFVVEKRPAASFTIAVSHGEIVVIGTRFLVEQHPQAGRVAVEEGIVEFRWFDGTPPQRLTTGDALEWPRPMPPELEEEPPPPPPTAKKPAPRMSANDLMRRLFQLKSQRRFDEAIDLLRDGSRRRDFTEVQRERLSFELGNVLRQSGRNRQACRHLAEHLARFPSAPRRAEIERSLAECR